MVIIVMGVAGSGKSTIGSLLGSRLGWQFVEGDEYHSPIERREDARRYPADRRRPEPWLEKLSALIAGWNTAGEDTVMTCSALRRAYREQLGLGEGILYVYLKGTRA